MDEQLRQLQDLIHSATRDFTDAELSYRPEPGKWTPAEVLEHLILTYKGTIKNLDRNLQTGKPPASIFNFKQRLRVMLVVDFGYFPQGRKSPEAAVPKGVPTEHVLAEFESQIAAMNAVISKCETQFGKNSIVAIHPILGPLTAKQWRKFHLVHGRHHVGQITGLRRELAASKNN